jgi:hypothetical protein
MVSTTDGVKLVAAETARLKEYLQDTSKKGMGPRQPV